MFKFRTYVAGDAPNSTQAFADLTAFYRAHLMNRHEIETVDVFREPQRALIDGVFLPPTLVKLAPSPVQIIVVSLSQTQTVWHAFNLEAVAL